jgi:hypothetical protein
MQEKKWNHEVTKRAPTRRSNLESFALIIEIKIQQKADFAKSLWNHESRFVSS